MNASLRGGVVLDFGMGNGVHLKWLQQQSQSLNVFGCDIAEAAVSAAKNMLPDIDQSQLVVLKPGSNINGLFQTKFDLICANQVLYYLEQPVLENVIDNFYKMLNPGGIIFVSMMSDENFYYKRSSSIEGSQMRRVKLSGRLNEQTEINFKSKSQLLNDFRAFNKIQLGYYDNSIREDEGSTKHYFFIGTK